MQKLPQSRGICLTLNAKCFSMVLLKRFYTLSDEQLWECWMSNPYFQDFTGETFVNRELLRESSGVSHWCRCIYDRLEAGSL